MNLAQVLRQTADATPGRRAFAGLGDAAGLTYGELDSAADAVARTLQGSGLEKGDRVAIVMGNRAEFASGYFGVLRAGGVAVPINTMSSPDELEAIVQDCTPAGLLYDERIEGTAGISSDPGLGFAIEVGRWPSDADGGRGEDIGGDDEVAVLAYTSGTSGAPRGAMLTHSNLLASLDQQQRIEGGKINPDDVVLVTTPLFHIFGLNVVLALTMKSGATAVMPDRFDAGTALDLIERHRVTVLIGAPTMYRALLSAPRARERDLSSVRLASSGAAPLPVDVMNGFEDAFGVPIYEAYGLTETSPSLTSNRIQGHPRPGSVGRPLPGVELRIVDEDFDEVEVGDTGEVVVKGPNVFQGYWNRPNESRAAFTDGWFHTGDIGVLDEDGFLYLVDRKRELIIVSGFNVFPSEVEQALARHPSVAEAAVVGVPHPYTGESVVAFVVPKPGATLTEAEIDRHAEATLARFKRPARVEIVERLPHLATGKVLKRALHI